MAAQNAAAPDPVLLAAWTRDYHRSLTVILAGIILLVATLVFSFWAISTGSFSTSGMAGFPIGLTGVAGFMLIVLGGSWAYSNRRLLQVSERLRRGDG